MLNKLVNVFVATPKANENTATKAKKKLSPLEVKLLMLERKKARMLKEAQK